MSRVALDTSAYSMLRRGREDVLDVLTASSSIFVPVVVVGELQAGFRVGHRLEDNLARLAEFLDEPDVALVEVDGEVAARYARIFAGLRRAGTPIPTNDIWIAACADRVGARLLTFDRDFERIEGFDARVLSMEAP